MKKTDKILKELNEMINKLQNKELQNSGVVGSMEQSNNNGVIAGLEIAIDIIQRHNNYGLK